MSTPPRAHTDKDRSRKPSQIEVSIIHYQARPINTTFSMSTTSRNNEYEERLNIPKVCFSNFILPIFLRKEGDSEILSTE